MSTESEKRANFIDKLKATAPQHAADGGWVSTKDVVLPPPMLDVVFRDGRIRSFSYAYIAEVEFEPGDTLTIKLTTGTVVIAEGRGLGRHRQQVRLHRADEIRECSGSELALGLTQKWYLV